MVRAGQGAAGSTAVHMRAAGHYVSGNDASRDLESREVKRNGPGGESQAHGVPAAADVLRQMVGPSCEVLARRNGRSPSSRGERGDVPAGGLVVLSHAAARGAAAHL